MALTEEDRYIRGVHIRPHRQRDLVAAVRRVPGERGPVADVHLKHAAGGHQEFVFAGGCNAHHGGHGGEDGCQPHYRWIDGLGKC